MAIDINTLPISGAVLVAGGVWIGVSYIVLAPELVERKAVQIGWQTQCQASVRTDLMGAQALPPMSTPLDGVGCNDLMGAVVPSDHRPFFDMFGLGMVCDAVDQAQARKRQIERMREDRMRRSLEEAGSKCACAVTHLSASKRWDFALAAGTARLVEPASVANFETSLTQSLRSPACAVFANAEG
ncbi:hypothetical protein [uncultured Hoeflea sp.]|uniref:hypothetical protein n=1 Tax=uncultured Hoeflea sp. TaxID=538666 RepID=UPI00260C48B4|nr:hypothetical protein [uncultured Hoeflea sp.]